MLYLTESMRSAGGQAVQDSTTDAEEAALRGRLWDYQVDQQRSLWVCQPDSLC